MSVQAPTVIFDSQMLAERQYWKERLSHPFEAGELRADFGRAATAPGPRDKVGFRIDDAGWTALSKLANGNDMLVFVAMTAAVQATLYKYTGNPAVAVGSAARDPEVGNAVVVRTLIDPAASFRDLLLSVRQTLLDAYRHQGYPFARVVRDAGLSLAPTRCPLFDVALRMEGMHGPLPRTGCEIEIVLDQGGRVGVLSFDTHLFRRQTMEHLARNLLGYLSSALRDTSRPVAELSALDDAEFHRIVAQWNDTAADYPRNARIEHLFETWAQALPGHPAVSAGAVTLGYGELDRRANQMAHLLAARGVGRGDRVALWAPPTAETIVAMLAVLKAGASYVPIDAGWPCERAGYILGSLSIQVLLVGRAKLSALHQIEWSLEHLRAVICLDETAQAPPPEAIADRDAIRSVWDFIVESAPDEVGAAGFISSYTGLPFSPAEVAEYVGRVVGLVGPHLPAGARVLEIGCGSGLLMFELAGRTADYVGIDPSPQTQARNRRLAEQAGLTQVSLLTGFADELDALLGPSPFDMVLIASTAQFFPGPRYLERVVATAMRHLKPGGALVLADLLDIRRKAEFAASLAAFELAHRGDASVHTQTNTDRYLHVAPALFEDLRASVEGLARVEVLERSRGFENELKYRFDVVLHKAADGVPLVLPAPRRTLDTLWHAAPQPTHRPESGATAEDEAYVIHTSGSTGQPKGVAVRHRPVVNVIHWVNRLGAVGPGDRLLFVTSLCFDLSVYDIFGTLAAGATIEVADDDDRMEPERLMALIRERKVTIWDSAPAALERLVPHFPPPAKGSSRLRLVMLSGDWIPIALPDLIAFSFPEAALIALGGATEATIWSNWHKVEKLEPHWVSVPYGRPIQNARYYILDEGRRPCPVGVAGDLYIGGEVLADGYVNQPELTAERFVADPFSDVAAARMYKTGDRAMFWEDGTMEFLGRLDHQVKIRGYRIETAEIEAHLKKFAAVREAIVIARGSGQERRLLAYVVMADGVVPTSSDFHDFLKERLPAYMIPSAFVVLDRLPLSTAGKIDRKALPDPDTARPDLRDGFAEPEGEAETAMAEIWKEVLKIDAVGRFDNFFELGGNSLQGTQILSRVWRRFNVDLPLSKLFSAPRIADLAALAAAAKTGTP